MSEYAKIKWHCRRGMRELDLLLERFLESGYGSLTDTDKALFSRFLEEPNERLVDWLLEGGDPPDTGYGELIDRIRGACRT